MEKTLQEILAASPYIQMGTLKEALDTYKHIELTEQEMDEAILWAKQRKEARTREAEMRKIQRENRKSLTFGNWTVKQTEEFMRYRAAQIYKGQFVVDNNNAMVFVLLCLYFSRDVDFVSTAINLGIENASLDKGILLYGGFGGGKTWMMQLFSRNQRQVYYMRNAKNIANDYEQYQQGGIEEYIMPFKNAINDIENFYHPYSGLCIDDVGTEGYKQSYGNKKNVIGDIIEQRYASHVDHSPKIGPMLHCTTNLTADEINSYYGGRVASRMREIFNTIQLPGADRRR